MSSLRSLLLVVAAFLAAFASAQDVKVEKYRLPNGMRVILHEDHTLPIATINLWYRVGSKDEPPRRSGFAHLFEHLMFMGTKRVPGNQFDVLMERAGGSNNATTAEDRTNYFSSGPSHLLPTLLWLDADRLESLAEAMTQEKLDLQRDVVRNERRQNVENTPYGKAYESINGLMFQAGHPYHTSVIGSHEDLEAARLQDVVDFFNTFYVPNNASLVVAGDFDPKVIKPLIDKWFGSLPRANDPIRPSVPPIAFSGVKRVTMVDQVQFAKTIMAWHSPAAYKPGDIEMQLASAVLSDGLDSRLYQRLVVKDQIATDVATFQEPRLLGSLFYVDATLAPGASQDQLEKAIDEELARFRREGPTPEELARIKSRVEFSFLNSLQSVRAKADKLNEYEFYFGEPNSFKRVLDMFRSATPEQVRDQAAKTLDPNNRLILRVIPQAEKPEVNPRDDKPALEAVKDFAPAQPKQFTLKNGIKVYYWHRPELPLMSIATLLKGGADMDPPDKAGRTSMMADMLDEGAGNRTAQQFENALDALGASFGASAGRQTTSTSLSVIASNFKPAMTLYADALLRPRFDAAEWARVQRTSVAGLEQSLDDPGTLARLVAMREYFGWEHPYGRPVSGMPETVKALALEELRATYRRIFQPQNATFFVAGSLPEDQVRAELEAAFGNWKSTGELLPRVEYPEPKSTGLRLVIVDKPGAVQTVIRYVLPGVPYGDPRRLRYEALGTILGGSFTSRLNQNLREAKGYTYGAGSSFAFEPPLGFFVASSSVRADVTGASIDEFMKEFKDIRTGNITPDEAEKARSMQRAAIVDSMGSLQSVLATAMSLAIHNRSIADLGKDLAEISVLNAEELNKLAAESVALERGVLVLVGDKDLILKQIEGKDLPKPEIVEVKRKE